MAQFAPAYSIVKKFEGFYVNNPLDKGGETYAGVARNFWPNWSGWAVIDRYKAQLGRALKTNEQVPGMDGHVEAFYKMLWDKDNFGAINSQEVANILYDYKVNSGALAIKKAQQILNDQFAKKLVVDGGLGPLTLSAINSVDPAKLHNAIKAERERFYYSLVERNPSQSVFLKGWLSRINSFPTLTQVGIGLSGILVLTGLFFLVYNYTSKNKLIETR